MALLTSLLLSGCSDGDTPIETGVTDGICVSAVDTDGDFLPNCIETLGWTVAVSNGVEYRVTSSLTETDTDGDGLSDLEEMANGTDPQKADTDGDTLSDADEVNVYLSSALNVDSDGDTLRDGPEVNQFRTSPTLDDTDGDGAKDDEEVHTTGFNPLIAELPKLDISISTAPTLDLNFSGTSASGRESYSASLQSRSEAVSRGASSSTSTTKEKSESVSASLEATFFPPGGSASVSASANWSEATTNTSASSWSGDSTSAAQDEYSSSVSEQGTVTFENGTIKVGFSIVNSGERSVTVTNLKIAVLKRNVFNYSAQPQLIAELVPRESTSASDIIQSFQMANGSSKGPLLAEDTGIPTQTMQNLLADPRGLEFVVSSFDFSDPALDINNPEASTLNYTQIAQDTAARTALIIIDYGDGRVVKKMVATSAIRDAQGNSAGLTMAEILSIMNVSYDVVLQDPDGDGVGREVLTRVEDVEAVDPTDSTLRAMWFVASSSPDATDSTVNFEDITLRPRDIIRLIYSKDSDNDGLTDRHEMLYGTNIKIADTDADGVNDGDEVELGTDPLGVVANANALQLNGEVLTLVGDGTDQSVDGKTQATLINGEIEHRPLALNETYAQIAQVFNLKYHNNAIYFTERLSVRKIDLLTNDVTTLAGGSSAGCADGPGTTATFSVANGLVIDSEFIYVNEFHCNMIRKISLDTFEVSTLVSSPAGSGSDMPSIIAVDGPDGTAQLKDPRGMTQAGNYLYITEGGSRTIRKVNKTTGFVTTVAGNYGSFVYAVGQGANATFNFPGGIVSDGIYLYVADTFGQRISKIRIDNGEVTTLAGDTSAMQPLGDFADGAGADARFSEPGFLYYDGKVLWLSDAGNHVIRNINPITGETSTVSGVVTQFGGFSEGTAAQYRFPYGITSDGRNLYIADQSNFRIRILR